MIRRTVLAGALVAATTLAFASEVGAVPSFVRITGLTCNQCHVQFTPNPDFTWTGKKFRWNGMRAPWVQQKIVAGDEGAITGRRLSLNFVNYFSMGFEQTLVESGRGASNPALPLPGISPLSGNPAANLSTFYAGPIGDHIGVWNEIYWTAAGAESDNPFRLIAWDELDLKLVWNPGGNIVGMSVHTEPLPTTFAFQFNSGAPSHVRRGGTAQAHAQNMGINVYGFWGERLLTVLGVTAGEDNNDWQTLNPVTNKMERSLNFQTLVSYALMNQDKGDMWLWAFALAGNDAVPMTTNAAVNRSTRAFSFSSNIRGLTALIPSGQPYLSTHMGDTFRSQFNWEYGFIDRGKWSARTAIGGSYSKDTYSDGASITESGIGWTTRWNYDRTWEWQLALAKRLKWSYTDVAGVPHDIPNDMTINARFHRRLAMNFVSFLVMSNSQTFAIQQNWRNGYSWEIGFDYYF